MHRLAPQYVHDINSPLRHVRTRIYFTSESHIHSLVNILRFSQLNGQSLVSEEAQAMLDNTTEFDYLTQIVFRMYENTKVGQLPQNYSRTILHQQRACGMLVCCVDRLASQGFLVAAGMCVLTLCERVWRT
jgi:hypothetical protein